MLRVCKMVLTALHPINIYANTFETVWKCDALLVFCYPFSSNIYYGMTF